jgi:hypothetical protein
MVVNGTPAIQSPAPIFNIIPDLAHVSSSSTCRIDRCDRGAARAVRDKNNYMG